MFGEVVIAYVALCPRADVTVDELHTLCAERLARYKRPVPSRHDAPTGSRWRPRSARTAGDQRHTTGERILILRAAHPGC